MSGELQISATWIDAHDHLMCNCDHVKSMHYYGASCLARVLSHTGPDYECGCKKFKEAKQNGKPELSKR